MNPPTALHGAMRQDRKPFTYTPGGLDLSEIKSQRMAQRLMRNAMNPGVPEVPVHPVLPSTTPISPVKLPNFNCLPVQVFPTLPANPKTLLRTKSCPYPREEPVQRVVPSFVNNTNFENNDALYKNTPTYPQQTNHNRHHSMYENSISGNNVSRLSYGSDGYTPLVNTNLNSTGHMPLFVFTPVSGPVPASLTTSVPAPITTEVLASVTTSKPPVSAQKPALLPVFIPKTGNVPLNENVSYKPEIFDTSIPNSEPINGQLSNIEISEEQDKVPNYDSINTNMELKVKSSGNMTVTIDEKETVMPVAAVTLNSTQNKTADVLQDDIVVPTALVTKYFEENADIDSKQREVKVVKKQVTKKVEEQNGDQNGDANNEAETTVKLPAKKSGAKTETKVEVERKVLPDGSVEEVKTTTTRTTIDGRTEIKTKTETTITPKQEESEEEVEEEEEEEEEEEVVEHRTAKQQEEVIEEPETVTVTQTLSAPKENGTVVKTEEKSDITIAKKVVVVQEQPQPEKAEETEEEEEVEEEDVKENAEPVTFVLKKPVTPEPKVDIKPEQEENEEVEEVEEEPEQVVQETVKEEPEIDEEEEEIQEKEEIVKKEEIEVKQALSNDEKEDQEEEYEEAEEEKQEDDLKLEEKTEAKETKIEEQKEERMEEEVKEEIATETKVEEAKEAPKEEYVIPIQIQTSEESKPEEKEDKPKEKPTEFTIPIREPSVPLEKVEDVEIKPIGISPIISKTHTENTEIITSTLDPSGGVSKQTEYNKIENTVTVNRTTKILDHSYENLTQQGIPTVKTYFAPPNIDKITQSPLPSRPYQPVYPPEPTTERRHSLLLERLSVERQLPTDIYQYSNQSYDQTQYQGEPQSEVLTVSNVKPSTITNQQWYLQNQQTKQTQNVLYNNVTSNPSPVGVPWAETKSPQPQQQYQPPPQQQYQPPPQQQYQPAPQQQYQPPPQQPQYQAQYQPTPQPQFQRAPTPQPQFQRGTTPQPQFQKAATPQPQYQPSYSEPTRERTLSNSYSPYTQTPTWVSNTVDSTSTPYSYSSKDTTQSYSKNTLSSSTQQYVSSYVPPPWEQDSSYISVNNTSEKYYQEVPQAFSPGPSHGWKPARPPKFTKNAPIAYVPPAPNQSFVRSVSNVEPPRQPGRKTYYSEYERRYITVPESTYIPTETKFQPQPDPSPQYYYDNNEPTETVEPQWRKELREFTEKTSQTVTTEQTNVQPPWEADSKYDKTPSSTYTPTPTWSQKLRPQSYRERSFESEYVSQEWPKTNTLGRGRPLSTLGKSVDTAVPERVRGVSVDRYNPNNYQPPAEHPPVQTHTLTTPVPHSGHHNPNVPAYHARASAEPRELPSTYQQRVYREARASPLQSRSFKYLQWITGTEN